jgi:hypothetical protein
MQNDPSDREDLPSRSRALVPWGPAPEQSAAGRALAGFVTQLLACEARLSAYRQRRRAEPQEASLVYAGGAGRPGLAPGRLVREL